MFLLDKDSNLIDTAVIHVIVGFMLGENLKAKDNDTPIKNDQEDKSLKEDATSQSGAALETLFYKVNDCGCELFVLVSS